MQLLLDSIARHISTIAHALEPPNSSDGTPRDAYNIQNTNIQHVPLLDAESFCH